MTGGKNRIIAIKEITTIFVERKILRTIQQKANVKNGAMDMRENLVPTSKEDNEVDNLTTAQYAKKNGW